MYRVLIADDEMIERKALRKKLQARYGDECEFFEAENGREALRIYAEKEIQILLLDIEMPGITGLAAAERIRQSDPNVCIIFLTAYDEFSYAKKAVAVHALEYLLKPCDERELLLVMDAAMDYAERLSRAGEQMIPLPEIPREQEPPERQAPPEQQDPETEDERSRLRRLMQDFIELHYREELSVQDIAGALHYSEAYFCRLFKQYFGRNFITYLSEYRIQRAKAELRRADANIREVGRAVGYPDSNYFAKVFKRVTGQSPSEYRLRELLPQNLTRM